MCSRELRRLRWTKVDAIAKEDIEPPYLGGAVTLRTLVCVPPPQGAQPVKLDQGDNLQSIGGEK